MKVAIIGETKMLEKSSIAKLGDALISESILEVRHLFDGMTDTIKDLHEFDLIITLDLAGFEQCTLTDGLSYNLINSKFVHLLLHEHLPNERYLNKQLSISMFFYCVGKDYYNYLLNTYPEIPYLKELEGWESNEKEESAIKRNAACIIAAIEEVIRECRL